MHNRENYSGEKLFTLQQQTALDIKHINVHKSVHMFQHRWNPFTNHQPGGFVDQNSWSLLSSTLLSQTLKAVSHTHAYLIKHCRDWHKILHSAGSSQKSFTMDHTVCGCVSMWTVGGCVLHSTVMLWSQSAQHPPEERHYCSIILQQCRQTWPVPRAGTPASLRQTGCLHYIPPVLASLCLSSVFHFSPLPPILLIYLEGWKVSAGFLVSAAGSSLVFVTCSREQARSRQPGRASSQEVEF